MLQKWCNNFHSNCRNTFWTLTNCPVRFVTLDYTRKNGPKQFLTGKIAFFSKVCVFQQLLRCYGSDLRTCTKIVGVLFGPLQTVPWVLSASIIREKKAKTFFSLERLLFFSKLCVFQQLLRCYRSDVITSTVIVGIPFEPLQIVPWGLSHSIIRERMGQNNFLLERLLFFQKFVFFNNFLGVTEVI